MLVNEAHRKSQLDSNKKNRGLRQGSTQHDDGVLTTLNITKL